MQSQTKQKIILFDIDYVLIDSVKLRGLTREKISVQSGFPLSTIENLYSKFETNLKSFRNFSPQNLANFFADKLADTSIESKITKIYFKNSELYKQSVYPEVMSTLERLKQKYLLGIYSEGNEEFQTVKITLSGIINFLEKNLIFIPPNKTENGKSILKKIEKAFVVDDNPKHIRELMETEGAHPIWLKRGPKAEACSSLNCPTILSLEELGTVLY